MTDFIIYPAIDLRYGQVVRLRQGKGDQQTVYGDDPAGVAKDWIDQGAEWLHVVNLNGAFGEGTEENMAAIREIVTECGDRVKIQLGGGIHTAAQVEAALGIGVRRVVLGTAVIEDPALGESLLGTFGGEAIVLGFDALNGELMTRGWQERGGITLDDLAVRMTEAGAQTLIYTDIRKDGMQTGVDWETARRVAGRTGMQVIASGGVASLDDIRQVKAAGLAGVIVGRALYEGNFSLQEALDVR